VARPGKDRNGRRRVLRWAAGWAAAALLAALAAPAFPLLAERTLLASAALALPDAGLGALQRRFAPSAQPPVPQASAAQPPAAEETGGSLPAAPEVSSAGQEQQVPTEYRGTILRETMTGSSGGTFISLGSGWLRNYTDFSAEEIGSALNDTPLISIPAKGPQVLIMHTHATESYETHTGGVYDTRSAWRTRDDSQNMCAVGDVLAGELEAAGIGVIHDKTQHDYPSYNGSYVRSRATVSAILARYPTIRVILDLHRDAIQRDESTIVAPVATIDGQRCAQVMVNVACGSGGSDLPNWRQNLRFGAEVVRRMESDWPTLTRPLFFCSRRYNQDLSPGALLIEVGSSGNTLEEACRSARMAGQSLAEVLGEMER